MEKKELPKMKTATLKAFKQQTPVVINIQNLIGTMNVTASKKGTKKAARQVQEELLSILNKVK